MQIWEMREALYTAYPDSESWKKKVNEMPDSQVFAVYTRMKNNGLLGRKKMDNRSEQLSMF